MAKERRAFIDGLAQSGSLSKEEIIFTYVKKYGLDSFYSSEKRDEYRRKLAASAPADRPIISLSPASRDLGRVSQKEGVAVSFFNVENKGKSELVITRLETSCGCTSASIIYKGKEGPVFNMPGHGINEKIDKNWKVSLPPGASAKLKVYYDPNVHKKFRGPAVREVSVFSNDPVDFEKKVRIELEQVD